MSIILLAKREEILYGKLSGSHLRRVAIELEGSFIGERPFQRPSQLLLEAQFIAGLFF